jgi:hypothetical protein
MPPMVCPSPIILDHSFPANRQLLEEVLGALGSLQEHRELGDLIIIASPIFPEFATSINWQRINDFPELRDICRYLVQLFLQPNTSYIPIDTDLLPPGTPHPLPVGCAVTSLSQLWSEELGKIKLLHDAKANGRPFIGIACHEGFSGSATGAYPVSSPPGLPLVGAADLPTLDTGLRYQTAPNVLQAHVSYADAVRNLILLDGTMSNTAVGSHYTVHFPNAPRPWVLSYNIDPVSESYLRQIPVLINKPLDYIKHVLLHGEIPSLGHVHTKV